MTQEELSSLIKRYLSGHATPEERRLLDAWYYEHAGDEWVAELEAEGERDDEVHLERRMLDRLNRSLDMPDRRLRPAASMVLRIAALLVLAVGIGAAIYYTRHSGTGPSLSAAAKGNDVTPGTQKAVLTLADGARVALDSNRSVAVATQGNASVRQVQGGILAYEATGRADGTEPVYNTLSVPRGGQYQLVLPDGSRVWLNAASSIRYPVSFASGTGRSVEITGEAYFEIAPDPGRPFTVHMGQRASVQVLGTHFDVNAYEDEDAISTTLLEGRVNVSVGDQTVSLKPGQEAIAGKALRVNDTTDLEAAVAWKEGFFFFNSEDIPSIMRQIARWYDVTVVYEGNVQGKTFTGQISRYANVSEVLNKLELTNDIHFDIEGKKITVKP